MAAQNTTDPSEPAWNYPTRQCRLCFEDVVPTVTMYPPGLPARLQHPVVEYKNDDEYGRLLKPCLCKGGMRYVHELCLQRQRTEGMRRDSSWKCPTCGYTFNFQRLRLEKFLASRGSVILFTVLILILMIFILGFLADPIINLCIDPYYTWMTGDYWQPVTVDITEGRFSSWGIHFTKGLVSLGAFGILKIVALNPFSWLGGRHQTALLGARNSDRRRREDVVTIGWIAVAVGVATASYLFYQWVQSLVSYSLVKIGERVVDTQLPDDDDDIRPPAGWRPPAASEEAEQGEASSKASSTGENTSPPDSMAPSSDGDVPAPSKSGDNAESYPTSQQGPLRPNTLQEASLGGQDPNSEVADLHRQGWSFVNI